MNAETIIRNEMWEAVKIFHRLRRNYILWFTLYADPLSDDILLDIHEQAMKWALEQ